jgi:hypothetical protein
MSTDFPNTIERAYFVERPSTMQLQHYHQSLLPHPNHCTNKTWAAVNVCHHLRNQLINIIRILSSLPAIQNEFLRAVIPKVPPEITYSTCLWQSCWAISMSKRHIVCPFSDSSNRACNGVDESEESEYDRVGLWVSPPDMTTRAEPCQRPA